MKKILFLLGNLIDTDIKWLNENATQRICKKNEVLMKQGESPKNLYIIVEGKSDLVENKRGKIASLTEGDVIGEISFVDERLASTSLIAIDNTRVLSIERKLLRKKLDNDSDFSARFYRGLSMLLADRLRKMILGPINRDNVFADELEWQSEVNPELLHALMVNGKRYLRLIKHESKNLNNSAV